MVMSGTGEELREAKLVDGVGPPAMPGISGISVLLPDHRHIGLPHQQLKFPNSQQT